MTWKQCIWYIVYFFQSSEFSLQDSCSHSQP